jgi:hypothetical protein
MSSALKMSLLILFAGRKARRECPFVRSNTSRWESGFKLNWLPEFQGCLQLEELLDWVTIVEEVLDFSRKCKMIEEFLSWQPNFGEEPLRSEKN